MKMIRWAFLFLFLILSIVCTFDCDTVSPAYAETVSSYILSDLQYEQYDGVSRIIFASNERLDFVSYELQNPYRIIVDFIGVSFCELQEHVEYDQGLVRAIDIIETPYAQKPEGLDEYFYSVDYIIITPKSRLPFRISASDDKKVIAVDIGEEFIPSIKVKGIIPSTGKSDEDLKDAKQKKEEGSGPDISGEVLSAETVFEAETVIQKENIIEGVNIESLEDSTLVVITSNNNISLKAHRDAYSDFHIIIRPLKDTFTELKNYTEFDKGYIRSIKIVKNNAVSMPDTLDSFYYPVKYIIIEPNVDFPFDFYSNEDSTIFITEIYSPDIEEEAKKVIREADKKAKSFEQEARRGLLKQLKREIKREGLLKQEKIEELKREELESRKEEASRKAETIGREVLRDLIVTGKGMLSLKQAQAIAVENSRQAKTAKKEVDLARMKQRDAFRDLFPNVKLKASHTAGDIVDDVGFTEELYGIEGEQALYQGGRLVNAYKQSKVNVKLADAKYSKLENDLDFKVAEAYYNIVTAIMNIRLQAELLEEAEAVVTLAEKRRESGLSTEHEILNVRSRYNQIEFQLATAKRDLALARFKLKQAMGLDINEQALDTSDVDTTLEFKVVEVDLNECLKAASNNKPDIIVNKLLLESNEYGEMIAKGKKGFKVDVTGFYGRGDSYYDTEPKNLEDNWNIGLKVSKPFWFATPSYSFTKDKTSLKVGETDRTGSTVSSGELAILDKGALSAASDIEEAKINKEKAENDLIEARRQAALEIKEAYYSYQESILQVKNSLEKVRFHEEAVKLARAQASLNEALQSQLLEALIQLSDEKSVYIKALSDYNIALIKINKAIGIKDYYNLS